MSEASGQEANYSQVGEYAGEVGALLRSATILRWKKVANVQYLGEAGDVLEGCAGEVGESDYRS